MKTLAFALIISTLFSWTTGAQSMKPGIWKAKVKFKVNGIPLPETEDEECIPPHEARDVKTAILKDLQKKGCELKTWEVHGQNLNASLKCKNKDLDANGKLKGHFTKRTYNLEGQAKGRYKKMLPAVAKVEMTGEWIQACDK